MYRVLLLRGVNLGPSRRISMPRLRELLAAAGHEDVRTYVQSGNVVLRSERSPDRLARECETVIAEGTGLEAKVVARTARELEDVVERNPLAAVAAHPKLHYVCFLSGEPEAGAVAELDALATGGERLVAAGRELHAWFPNGSARSKLASRMADPRLGVTATARNWRTVTALLEMTRA